MTLLYQLAGDIIFVLLTASDNCVIALHGLCLTKILVNLLCFGDKKFFPVLISFNLSPFMLACLEILKSLIGNNI